MSRRKEPEIPSDLLDQLLAGGDAAADLQQGGLLNAFPPHECAAYLKNSGYAST